MADSNLRFPIAAILHEQTRAYLPLESMAGPSFHLRMLREIRNLDRTVETGGDGNQLDWEPHLIWSSERTGVGVGLL
jgi:alpha-glucuronidase